MHFSFTLYSGNLKASNTQGLTWRNKWILSAMRRLLNHVSTSSSRNHWAWWVPAWNSLPPAILTASPCTHSFIQVLPNASFLVENVVVRPSLTSPFSMAVSVPLPCFFFTAHIVTCSYLFSH